MFFYRIKLFSFTFIGESIKLNPVKQFAGLTPLLYPKLIHEHDFAHARTSEHTSIHTQKYQQTKHTICSRINNADPMNSYCWWRYWIVCFLKLQLILNLLIKAACCVFSLSLSLAWKEMWLLSAIPFSLSLSLISTELMLPLRSHVL